MLVLGKARVTGGRRRCLAKGNVCKQQKSDPQTKKRCNVLPDGKIFELHECKNIVAVGSSARHLSIHTSELEISAVKTKASQFVLHGRVI
jgi:hypothetical protein